MTLQSSHNRKARRTLRATCLTLAITLALDLALPAAAQQYSDPYSSTNTSTDQQADAGTDRNDREKHRFVRPDQQHAHRSNHPQQGYGASQATPDDYQARPAEYGDPTQRGRTSDYNRPRNSGYGAGGYNQGSPSEKQQGWGNGGSSHNTVHPIRAGSAYGNQPRPTEYGESAQRGKPGAYGNDLDRAHPAHGTDQNSPAESPQNRGNNVQFHNTVHPIEARTAYGNAKESGHGPTQGNPSMHRGEACPPNSPCGVSPSGSGGAAGADHGASHARSGDQAQRYSGASADRYSREAQAPRAAEAGKPVRADVSEQHVNPALTHGARVSATGQHSNTSFNDAVNGKSGVGGTNAIGPQRGSYTGPDGQSHTLGGSQTYTGPDGQKHTLGGSQTYTGPDGQKQTFGSGATTATHTGGSNDMPKQNSLDTNGSGLSNVADNSKAPPVQGYDATHHIDTTTGQSVPNASSASGGDSEAAAQVDGEKGFLENSRVGQWLEKHFSSDDSSKGKGSSSKQEGGGVGDDPDVGQRSGGSLVNSGTGKRVQPGKHQGQDNGGGGGQTGEFNSKGGGANAQGKTFKAPIGQDVTKGPRKKLIVPMKTDDNGKNGVTDPAQNGNGGG